MKPEQKLIICEQFGRLVNASRMSKSKIAKQLGINSAYLSWLFTHQENLSYNVVGLFQEILDTGMTLDEYLKSIADKNPEPKEEGAHIEIIVKVNGETISHNSIFK